MQCTVCMYNLSLALFLGDYSTWYMAGITGCSSMERERPAAVVFLAPMILNFDPTQVDDDQTWPLTCDELWVPLMNSPPPLYAAVYGTWKKFQGFQTVVDVPSFDLQLCSLGYVFEMGLLINWSTQHDTNKETSNDFSVQNLWNRVSEIINHYQPLTPESMKTADFSENLQQIIGETLSGLIESVVSP